MAGSIVVAVRSALMAALATEINGTAGMESVAVGFQAPVGDHDNREIVWSKNAQIDLKSASLRAGRNFLDETTAFEVVVFAWAPNQTAEEAAQRAVDIGEVACAWIGDHKNGETLGVTGLKWIVVEGAGSQDESLSNDSVAGHFLIPVKYNARLT
ncbi:hypothetical protein [Aeromicrobium sp.]|uniref:hypothetical protein n=1 Tax=Aeromicrobium sp. TaxID=1871063 RepID=UPI002FCB21DA